LPFSVISTVTKLGLCCALASGIHLTERAVSLAPYAAQMHMVSINKLYLPLFHIWNRSSSCNCDNFTNTNEATK